MPRATTALAKQKGFSLIETGAKGAYFLIDDIICLPALNPVDTGIHFTLTQAADFLRPLHDRNASREADQSE